MPEVIPITQYRIKDHDRFEMPRRQIAESEIAHVLSSPEPAEMVRPGRAVFQLRMETGEPPRVYLLRVFVDIDRRPAEVVKACRTSRIEKYWRRES